MTRLPITKTPKVYVGGAFIRSESARTFPLQDASGNFYANIPQCTRKDLRNAIEAAAKAGPGWARRTAYNRGQILYRLAEMLEARQADLNLSPEDEIAVQRRTVEGCQVLGLCYKDDRLVGTRFESLRKLLGDQFIHVEFPGNRHSVLTEDLQPEGVQRVVEFLKNKLLP